MKIKITLQKDQNQNQNHKDIMQLLQHIYVQKMQQNYAVIQCAKMHTGSQYSVTCVR